MYELLSKITQVVLLVLIISLIAGQVLGQPVLLAFVETGSMEPTMDPGDGFVAVPSQVAGPVEEGDVIVFEAEEIQGGGLTTHRVVDETDRGYLTRGDANPFTDQDSGEPPVKDAQIVATALQVGGQVVVIPHLGTVVAAVQGFMSTVQRWLASALGSRSLLGVQGLAYLFLAATVAWYLLGLWRGSGGRSRTRDRNRTRHEGTDTRLIAAGFALLVVVAATASMVAPAGTQEFGVVSAEFDSDRPTVIRAGESKPLTYRVPNGGLLPVVAYLEPASEGVDIRPGRTRVSPGGTATATVTLSAPSEPGYYRRFLVEHRYLAVLPVSVIDGLYRLHPWVPIVVIDLLVGLPFYALGVALLGRGRLRDRSRDRSSGVERLLDRL
jgi:signal peptidase